MFAEKLRELKRAEPFRPFEVLLNDGRMIPVTRPEWMLVTEDGRRLAVFQKDDSLDMVRMRLIKEVRVRGIRKPRHARAA